MPVQSACQRSAGMTGSVTKASGLGARTWRVKVQKANQRIFELQRTNEQMGRLLSKIPPEVLEELQRTGRNKSRER